MKILVLCNKPPYPAVDGGCLAMVAMIDGLLDAGVAVHVLALHTDKHPFLPEKFPTHWIKRTAYESVYVDTRVKAWPALRNVFQSGSYNVERFYSSDFATRLQQHLQQETYDIIHLESLYLTPYLSLIRQHSKAKVAMRTHNVEHRLWQRLTEQATGWKARWFSLLTKRMQAYEETIVQHIDALVPITQADADYFSTHTSVPIQVIPYAMPITELHPQETESFSVFHLGAMDWEPNINGVRWLVDEIWPLVLQELPQAKLYLAGRHLRADDAAYKRDGVTVVGEVADAFAFIASKAVQAIPLRVGGGMRVKLVEAMALQKAIVTTSIGAEGIAIENGIHAFVADDARNFALLLIRLLQDQNLANRFAMRARELAETAFDRTCETKKLLHFYNQLCIQS